MKNADMPAMPQSATSNGYGCNHADDFNGQVPTGLTKRETIAMNIMSSMVSINLDDTTRLLNATGGDDIGVMFSKISIEYADALLKELDKDV